MAWPGLIRTLVVGGTLLAVTTGHAAVSDETLARLKDHNLTLQLEQDLVAAVRSKDRKAVAKLATPAVRAEFATFAALSVGKAIRTPEAQELALKLGPCHYAGLVIRGLIVNIADKRVKPVPKSQPLEVVPEGLESLFVEHMRRCEIVTKLPVTKRLIGRMCAVDGTDCRPTD